MCFFFARSPTSWTCSGSASALWIWPGGSSKGLRIFERSLGTWGPPLFIISWREDGFHQDPHGSITKKDVMEAISEAFAKSRYPLLLLLLLLLQLQLLLLLLLLPALTVLSGSIGILAPRRPRKLGLLARHVQRWATRTTQRSFTDACSGLRSWSRSCLRSARFGVLLLGFPRQTSPGKQLITIWDIDPACSRSLDRSHQTRHYPHPLRPVRIVSIQADRASEGSRCEPKLAESASTSFVHLPRLSSQATPAKFWGLGITGLPEGRSSCCARCQRMH